MRNTLIATLALLGLGLAVAEMPADYQIVCDVDETLVGVVSVADGEVHAALQEDWTCDGGALYVTPDGSGVTVVVDADGNVELSYDPDGEGGSEAATVDYDSVPDVAIEGMLTAQANRAEAAANQEEAQAKAEEARSAAEDAGRPDDLPEPSEDPEEPDEPEEVETSDEDGRPEGVGKGRP